MFERIVERRGCVPVAVFRDASGLHLCEVAIYYKGTPDERIIVMPMHGVVGVDQIRQLAVVLEMAAEWITEECAGGA